MWENLRIRRRFLVLLMCFFTLPLLTGCLSKQADENYKKQIVIAVAEDVGVEQLDANSYDGLITVFPMVYDSLVEYGEKDKIMPSLAESWEISDDGKSYVFHLRKNVKFSDGTPLDADVVKFSLERWIGKPDFSNFSISKTVQSLEVVDSYTIKMVFREKCYTLLNELTFPRPVRVISPTGVKPKGDPEGKFIKPIGTGPWMVESYNKDQDAVLIKNPYYWGEKPKLDKIVLKVVPDSQSRILALQSGDVDLVGWSGKIPPESIAVLKKDETIEIYTADDTLSYFLVFNYDNSTCQDINVRKAINMAIDKKSMVAKLMDGVGKPAEGLFPYTIPYVTNQNNKWFSYNKEKAKELLQNAGYVDENEDGVLEKDGKTLELNLVLQNVEFPEWKAICEYTQSMLKEIGIKVNLQSLEPSAYYDVLWRNREYDLIIYRTYSDPWDPHGFLTDLFHEKGDTPAVVWADAELEKYIDEVIATMDEKERQQRYDQIFQLMYERAMCVPLYYTEKIIAVNNRVKGFEFGTSSSKPVILENLKLE